MVANDPGLHADELPHEITDVNDQIADDRKISQRLDAKRSGGVIRHERRAGQLRLTVHGHPATAANPHAAGPPVGERAVELVLDVIQSVEDHPVFRARHLVFIEGGLRLLLRTVTRYL